MNTQAIANLKKKIASLDEVKTTRSSTVPVPKTTPIAAPVRKNIRNLTEQTVHKIEKDPGEVSEFDKFKTAMEAPYVPYFEKIAQREEERRQAALSKRKKITQRSTEDVVAGALKTLKDIKRKFVAVPDLEDREWIRFNLSETLYALNYDIVASEFTYAGCRADIFAAVNNRAVEFEIKMSMADLLIDFKKRMTFGPLTPLKHNALASGKAMVSKFYFVVPEGLIDQYECPEYCGLIAFDITLKNGWLFKLLKPAPLLHKEYISASTWATIAKRLTQRCRQLTMKYAKNDFMAVRRLGLWQPRP